MINRVVLVGRITKDPELRKTQSGLSTVSFTIACNRRFSGANQEQQADFISCVAWRQSADFMASYVKKGSLLGVEGRIQTRNYDDANGKKVYVTEIVCDSVQILESKNAQGASQSYSPSTSSNTSGNSGFTPDAQPAYENDFSSETLDIASDDLPF